MNFVMMLALAATVSAAPAPKENPGKKIFNAQCTACHGKDAKGKRAMAGAFGVDVSRMNLTEILRDKTDADVIKIVTEGLNKKMPSFQGKLKEAEIAAVVSYVRTLDPKWTGKAGDAKAGDKKADEKPAGKN